MSMHVQWSKDGSPFKPFREGESQKRVTEDSGYYLNAPFPDEVTALKAVASYFKTASKTGRRATLRIVNDEGDVESEWTYGDFADEFEDTDDSHDDEEETVPMANSQLVEVTVERRSAGEWKDFRPESEEVKKVLEACGWDLSAGFDQIEGAEEAVDKYYELGFERDTRIITHYTKKKVKVKN